MRKRGLRRRRRPAACSISGARPFRHQDHGLGSGHEQRTEHVHRRRTLHGDGIGRPITPAGHARERMRSTLLKGVAPEGDMLGDDAKTASDARDAALAAVTDYLDKAAKLKRSSPRSTRPRRKTSTSPARTSPSKLVGDERQHLGPAGPAGQHRPGAGNADPHHPRQRWRGGLAARTAHGGADRPLAVGHDPRAWQEHAAHGGRRSRHRARCRRQRRRSWARWRRRSKCSAPTASTSAAWTRRRRGRGTRRSRRQARGRRPAGGGGGNRESPPLHGDFSARVPEGFVSSDNSGFAQQPQRRDGLGRTRR